MMVLLVDTALADTAPVPAPMTFDQALTMAYQTNPRLLAARRLVRQTDEDVPQALAGWRPRLTINTSAGGSLFNDNTDPTHNPERRAPQDYSLRLQQPLYTSGQVAAQVRQAEARVRAQRASLRASEAEVLLAAGQAYLDVVRDRGIAALNRNQVTVQERTARASAVELAAGAVAAADVGQARARLATAAGQLATAAATLRQSEAAFLRQIGQAPGPLAVPLRPFALPDTRDHAIKRAIEDNPDVVSARESLDAARNGIDIERAGLLPHISFNGMLQRLRDTDVQQLNQRTNLVEGTINMTIPLYQGGGEYSRIRQAKEATYRLDDLLAEEKRQAQQMASSAWDVMEASRVRVIAQKAAIAGYEIAVRGYTQQHQVGARTLLDVLITQQDLLSSQVAEVAAEHDTLLAALQLAATTGLLDAGRLKLPAEIYDPVDHYRAVRNKLIGTTPP